MGRKAINIDKDQFEELLELQCTKEDIAGFFHCSHDTIERFCKKTYGDNFLSVRDDYSGIGRVSLRRQQFAMAEKGNVPMLIHLGKQYLGQSDKAETKVSADVKIKHGNVTRLIFYDPETKETTKEEISGAEQDVDAYIEDPEGYNGDTMSFMLPNKDPDPAEIDMEPPKINITNGETGAVIEYPDDGRGGYTGDPQTDLIIEHALDNNTRVRLEWGNNKRGGHLPRKQNENLVKP